MPSHRATELPTICLLGATGVGKGSTLNSCFRSDKFGTSHMFASDTIKPASFVLPWKGTGDPMRGVDLCGFSDSEGRDTGFIEAMVSYLREEVRAVNCFLLLLNSQEARVGLHLKDMLVALKSVFGLPFMRNVVVGFTRWDYSRKGAILRRGVTKEVQATGSNGSFSSGSFRLKRGSIDGEWFGGLVPAAPELARVIRRPHGSRACTCHPPPTRLPAISSPCLAPHPSSPP